ncbi:MAG: hypothetical protein ACTTIV_07395 [Campylobacter sp.]
MYKSAILRGWLNLVGKICERFCDLNSACYERLQTKFALMTVVCSGD